MTAEVPARTIPARQPLSLRELFILTTLTACLVAAVQYREWNNDERWLLGLTLGGTLLGNLVGRSLSRRGWPLGLALGGIGAVAGTCVAFYSVYQEYYSGSPAGPLYSVVTQGLWGTAILGGLAGLLLVLLTQWAIAALLWLTSGESSGAISRARKHPWSAVTTAGLITALVLLGCNLEGLLWPHALSVRAEIPFEEEGVPLNLQSDVVDLALSRDGRRLAVSFDLGWPDDGNRFEGRTWLYEVSSIPRRLEPVGFNPRYLYRVSFDSETDRLALLDREGDQPVAVVDVTTERVYPPLKSYMNYGWSAVRRMGWLPDGRVALEEEADEHPIIFDVASGYVVGLKVDLDSVDLNALLVEPSREVISFEPRFGHEYRFLEGKPPAFGAADYVSLRVYNLTNRELLWDIACNIRNGDPAMLSHDGRFIMQSSAAGAAIVNVGEQESELLTGSSWIFSSRGHVIHCNVATGMFGLREHTWTQFVPLVRHVDAWWNRARVCWLDPDTGRVLARTAPLPNVVTNIAVSHDGSTIAATTWTGVYVFDVPQELR